MDLSGQSALVTGAGRGLGRAYALELARRGASVVVNDADADAATAVAEEITGAGGTAVAHAAPVGPAETARALVDTAVQRFGRLDVLVANAGVLRDCVLWKMSDEDFDTVIDVHLRGAFTCARAAVTHMRERGEGGRLIMVASPAGQRGNFGQTNYAAAKAGIAAMVRTWSMECARAGITVNAVVPVAATAMTATIPAFAEHVAAAQDEGVPLPGWMRQAEGFGTPEDCAGLVAYLASAESAHVTGQCVGVGGDRLSLWAHPQEVSVAYRDGGWSAEDIGAVWATTLGRDEQSVGIPAPAAPAGSAPAAPGKDA
ncbi:SDR family NAD(P)-dependent oxidoreductase [Nocardiopsis sp. NRRL B-16309]|uniref:SDR family NAD(P)-dependent oxidoreductase n=1 Tax=Nocardiopsis sp. NRRL B-16309 TaxID=1519494 RepID=UPI0006AF994A|nr:SDR family NAD(P)-dependent oxidoreductase [Nocardiopsis sp. NRRL B-16309]KOX16333.1 3-oxoacyl-ACP reductase [Nocardiopsis sp. NRRL B-16309]